MIGAVFDQVQKLFGRAFLIAAFVPTILFAAVSAGVWGGIATLQDVASEAISKGVQEVAFGILVVLALVYLLAYVAYGIRGALHSLYQGRWFIWPLTALAVPLTNRARRALRAADDRLERATLALDDPKWPAGRTPFAPSFTPTVIHRDEARSRLDRSRDAYTALLVALGEGPGGADFQPWREQHERCYWDVLRDVRLVQANANPRHFPPELRREIDQFAAHLHRDYAEGPHGLFLRTAVKQWQARTQADWQAAYRARHTAFTRDETWVSPTRLGNVARAQEFYAYDRYGIALSDLWPRVQHVLPEAVRRRVDEANTYLDFTVIMSAYAVAEAAVATGAAFWGAPRAHIVELLLPALCLSAAWLFYALAIGATESYGLQLQAAVDLYRLKLLDALGVAPPETPAKERETWTALRRFIVQGDPPNDLRFKQAQGGGSEGAPAAGTTPADTGC